MAIERRVEAAFKNIEGRLEEALGTLTGNRRLKAEGQAKQAHAEAQHTKEKVKDRAKRFINRF